MAHHFSPCPCTGGPFLPPLIGVLAAHRSEIPRPPVHPAGGGSRAAGIIYDTGGLSIKVGGGMVGMKSDCGGAAAILAAFRAAVACGATQTIHAVLCLAENAIGARPAEGSPRAHRAARAVGPGTAAWPGAGGGEGSPQASGPQPGGSQQGRVPAGRAPALFHCKAGSGTRRGALPLCQPGGRRRRRTLAVRALRPARPASLSIPPRSFPQGPPRSEMTISSRCTAERRLRSTTQTRKGA